MTPDEEIEEKIVLALLGEYAAAQVELRQAEGIGWRDVIIPALNSQMPVRIWAVRRLH